jgi:cation diffusion facilitator CzcD-associated flavoprotein CzcO
MPYPQHWPTYTPAAKLGDWLEYYAESLELRYWCSSSVVSAEQDKATGAWTVKVDRGGDGLRVMTPKHVVMATSLAGIPMMPTVPGMKDFNGTIRHSTSHDSSREWVGKKVLVVGTSSSGFDTAYDFARRDIDVTILQRSPTYIMSLTHSVPRVSCCGAVEGCRVA